MKKILSKQTHPFLPSLSGFLLLFLCTTPLFAAQGGFESGKDPVPVERLYAGHKLQQENRQSRIKDIRDLRKNAWVTLEGNIVSKGKDSNYIFRDTTGKIDIEIPDKVWSGQHFGAQDLVRVSGQVEGQGNETKIMVEVLSKP
ncbi:NirD/YgiW/YdeI family stress tolerance protein [Raoultella ornithinolytica]|uniref:YgiW/YdeI family stress tolerance OB fold protein n=1 Tax=Raoultella ornithinolytica TaxID=54291 RepID=UPI002FF5A9CC